VPKRRFRPAAALALLLAMPLLRPVFIPRTRHAPLQPFRPDLNRDPAARIRLVPGIGPRRARAIVAERRRGGPFAGPADVGRRVVGIGPALVRRLEEFSRAAR
jgi:DNA uptake protein ComE-like DNA-binding protein